MKYVPTIGIETHVQLKTKTKLFSAVGNDASQANPNTLISHIDVGLPGALPVLNEKALELATRAAFALNTSPQKFSKFDRKHYFYPDLPKGYQITQYEDPIIKGGYVEVGVEGKKTKIGITRVHLEEDAGKNTHPTGADYSLVDLNRAGTPLLEIVSEPDIHSAAEAKAYVRELYLLMKYADVSDCNLYLGHMRFDVNVSLAGESGKKGTRTETKNLNSFKSVEAAVEYEIKRQTELLEKGKKIIQETRGWDDAKQKTTSQRSKEEAEDYRYMPEPDIPPVELSEGFISEEESRYEATLQKIRNTLSSLGFDPTKVESFINLDISQEQSLSFMLFEMMSEENDSDMRNMLVMRAVNWMINTKPENTQVEWPTVSQLLSATLLFSKGEINSNGLDIGLKEAAKNKDIDFKEVAKKLNLIQTSDEGEIEKIVSKVLAENPKAAEDIKKGEMKAIGFLVGQVMAKSKGQANPGLAQQIIKKQLGL